MKKGIFSVSYAGYWGQESLDTVGFIRKAAELGYDGVLLAAKRPHISAVDSTDEDIASIKGALDEHGMECIGLAAYTDFLLRAPGEIPVVEMQEIYVDSVAKICSALGGNIVRIFTGYDRSDLSRAAQESVVVDVIRRCAKRAGTRDVMLSVQNHHDFAVATPEFSMLFDSIGETNVKAGYDAWSPHLRGEDLYSGARQMAPRMFMTICADYLTFPRYRYEPELVNYQRIIPDAVKATKMGKGEIDYDAFFRGLEEGGFDDWAVYEMCSPVTGGGSMDNLDRMARAFLSWFDN